MKQSIIKTVLFIIITIFISQSIFAQLRLQLKPRKYDILVKLTDKYAPTHRIEIKELRETSILATPVLFNNAPFNNAPIQVRTEEQQYNIQDIDHLSIRNNKKMRRRALIGSLIGLGVGVILSRTHSGHKENDHFLWSPGLEHSAYILAGVTTGGLLGALSGMFRVKIPFNGKKSLNVKQRKQLEKYIQY